LKDARIVPGPARPIHLYFLVDPSPGRSRGQPPGIARVDGRAKEGRLLKRIRKGILDHLSAQGGEPSIVHHSLTERAAGLEFNIPYVQNNLLASDITRLLRILKDHPAARLAIVNFYRDHSAPPKVVEHHAAGD